MWPLIPWFAISFLLSNLPIEHGQKPAKHVLACGTGVQQAIFAQIWPYQRSRCGAYAGRIRRWTFGADRKIGSELAPQIGGDQVYRSVKREQQAGFVRSLAWELGRETLKSWTGYCQSGSLKRIKQAFAWEQSAPPEGSKCDESNENSSSQQGDELYSGIDDLDYRPVIDLQARIQSDAWSRLFVSESRQSLAPSEESNHIDNESDDSDTLRNSNFDQDAFDYGSIDARPFPTYESRFRGGYRLRQGIDPALSINKATVE